MVDPSLYAGFGVLGLVIGQASFVFFALMKGWIYVGAVYDAQVKETGYWRDAYFNEHAARAETDEQNGLLIKSSTKLAEDLARARAKVLGATDED